MGAGLPAMQTARTGKYTAAMPSRASPLAQGILASREFCWSCITCGSWLACDADGADWQVHRSDAIASKPAPTGGGLASREFSWSCITCGSWLACDADGADWQVHRSDAIASKPAPTGGGAGKPRIQFVMHYLWELACLRCRRRGLAGTPQRCHREQARSHRGGLASREFSWSCITCGSWLACDAGGADWQVHRSDAIASRPAPTGGGFRFIRSTKIPSGKKSARPNPAGAANRPAPAGR